MDELYKILVFVLLTPILVIVFNSRKKFLIENEKGIRKLDWKRIRVVTLEITSLFLFPTITTLWEYLGASDFSLYMLEWFLFMCLMFYIANFKGVTKNEPFSNLP